MSNNLRQIAKDLRSFVKRCKDVHYSDSLLITFLVTGLLTTFAPSIIRADVAEDQQEVSAQAYDTITDLRQSFLRAKKENQKALRGANAELAQLLKQGDQVVKSPWASFQFGTGYTNNDWGTSYKGRGGKKLEYYSRTNDLTKYVFDASKHQYGATNLNVKRNKEPNSLAINPANVQDPYAPLEVNRLNNISPYDDLTFNPELQRLEGISKITVSNTTVSPRTVSHGTTGFENRKNATRNDNITLNSLDYGKFISDAGAVGTVTGGVSSLTPTAGGTFVMTGGTTGEGYYNAWRNEATQLVAANLQGIAGSFDNGFTYSGTYNMEQYTARYGTGPYTYATVNGTFTDPTTRSQTNKTGTGYVYDSVGSFTRPSAPGNDTYPNQWANPTATVRGASILVNSGNNNQIGASTFTVGDTGGSSARIGIHVAGGAVSIAKPSSFNTYGDGTGIYTVAGTTTDLTTGTGRATFTSYGTGNSIFNKGKINLTDADFDYGNTNTNNINYIYNEGEVNLSGTSTFDIYKSSNGIYSKTANGKVSDSGSKYYIHDDNAAGINNESSNTSAVTTNGTIFYVSDSVHASHNNESIGILTKNGTTNTTSSQFIINGGIKNNGIYVNGSSAKVVSTTDTFTVTNGELNSGIKIDNGPANYTAEVKGSNFTVGGTGPTGRIGAKNAGIRVNHATGDVHTTSSNGGTTGTRTQFTISGHQNAGIENILGSTTNVVEFTTFDIGGTHSLQDQTNTGISNVVAGKVTVKNNSIFNVNDSWNSGIFNYDGGTIEVTRDNNSAPYNKFYVNGNESNGIINYSNATAGTVDVNYSDFIIDGSRSNGILNRANGTVKVKNSNFTINDGVSNSNGFYERADGATSAIGHATDGTVTFNVNGTYNNGIYFKGDSTAATAPTVTRTTFNVNKNTAYSATRNNNTGILIGNSGTPNTKSNPLITDSTFNVYGKDTASTGILLDQGKVTIAGGTMNVTGNTNGITLIRNNRGATDGNTVTFNKNASGNAMTITTSGGANRAVNIQGGSYYTDNDIKLTGTVNMDITDNSTAGYLNQYYANSLVIKNNGGIPNTTSDQGRVYVTGSNNTVFANLGYAKAGSVELSDVLVKAANTTTPSKENTILYFAGNTAGGNKLQTNQRGAIGWFGGTVRVQGVIGSGDPTGLIPKDDKNVGIYAVSGQRSNLNSSYIGDPGTPTTMQNIDVDNFNIGVNGTATNTVLIYAGNGTGLNVQQGTNPIAGGTAVANADIITDGAESNGSNVVYNYKTHDNNTGRWTTIGYAVGEFNDGPLGLINAANSGENGKGSEINFKANVDMTSRQSTAFYAKDGGKVTIGDGTAKNTRAGGYESIVAYASGANKAGAGSLVKINGNITAADFNMLGDSNRKPGGSIEQWMATDSLQANTYKNIAAYAVDGGQVVVSGSSVATNAKEPTTAGTTSLVYGMAAYAEGKASKNVSAIDYQSGITVISGTNGALYATKDGSIKFQGNIVNQNNITARDSDTIAVDATNGTVNAGARYGRGPVTGVTNDHTTVTPFYVNWATSTDKAAIEFGGTTNIDMYDGIFFTGNQFFMKNDNLIDYNGHFSDYTNKASTTDEYKNAKYRGMNQVTLKILKTYDGVGGVNLGLINHKGTDITWDSDRDKTTSSGFLKGVADYAGLAAINNYAETGSRSVSGAYGFASTLINGNLKIDQDVNLENNYETRGTNTNDPFNNIKMESELVTINAGKKVEGDVANGYRLGQGLNMANRLYRWNEYTVGANKNYVWEKTANSESGYINKGTIDVSGGTTRGNVNIAGMRVSYGTASNSGNASVIKVDHGYGIVGTDNTIISNEGKIEVTGKFAGSSTKRTNNGFSPETDKPAGENYGIVGVSRHDTVSYEDSYVIDGKTIATNVVDITNKGGKITVEGTRARGIYAANVDADQSNVNILYDNSASATNQDLIRINSESTGNADNKGVSGVGIALVNKGNNTKTGGTITLNTKGDDLSSSVTPDIRTAHNGIGIYGESADIVFASASKGITIESKDNGGGIWVTDDSLISSKTDHLGTPKVLNYNYKGSNDKNAFGMIFSSTLANNTTANNYLDINFNNANGTMTLATEKLQSAAAAAAGSTYKGIAGIMVNTDAGDTVNNFGKIEEKVSTTNVRGYGAVVNRGNFVNYGEIKLKDSLDALAKDVTNEDLKKVNVGIFANNVGTDTRNQSSIKNYADITIGTTSNKNVGGFGIYGYTISTGAKENGDKSKITINRNSYGIFSGDGNVDIQNTKLLVGNDTVLGHKQHYWTDNAGVTHAYTRQTAYTLDQDLLPNRKTDAAYGVYIGSNETLSNSNRNVTVSADMDIDRYSYGIVLEENKGNAITNVTIGNRNYSPVINLASNTTAGGPVHSEAPNQDSKENLDTKEQGNAVYYYSSDKNSRATSYAEVKMNGDYNTAYYTTGSVELAKEGSIDLRSQYNLNLPETDPLRQHHGYGNVGIISANTDVASKNYGTITTGMSDTKNMVYSVGMGAGLNHYITNTDGKVVYEKTDKQGYVENYGTIDVKEKAGIGMLATGKGSKAINYGTINLLAEDGIGMYIDRNAIGINAESGVIKGNAKNLKGVIAINGGYIKNYGTIDVTGTGSRGIITDSSKFLVNKATGEPREVLAATDPRYNFSENQVVTIDGVDYVVRTAGRTNETNEFDYKGTETVIEEGTSGNPKTTGVGTTITRPDLVPLNTVTIDGVEQPIFNVESDAANAGDWAKNITVSSSIQTGGTRIIDLSTKDEFGNPAWPNAQREQLSEITRVGMYVDTSGVKYTNPIHGLEKLSELSKVDLYFGPEATLYTNSKAIRIGDGPEKDANGNLVKSNILKPFNDALNHLSGGARINPLSASLTWQVSAEIDDKNQISQVIMSKVPYHSFAFDGDKRLINFTNNLDNLYEIARPGSEEKMIFNKLNSLGNGEGHILAQAFDQMRGHIYGGIQQRTNATSNLLTDELAQLRSENNASKDSNKIKAFGRREEYKTDTAGLPDWHSNAGGFVYLHEDETVKLGDRSGWYAGVVNNYFTFKDLARSYENQAMLKTGIFKQTPLDEDGTFTFTIGGDAFFGKTNTKRRFWVVDKEFRAKSDYYTYGADINAKLEKEIRLTEGFSIVPNVGLDLQYGRFSTVNEDGDMALKIKSDDYYSVKPRAGVDFRYAQPVFKKSNFVASVGLAYETELGRLNDVDNEAKIKGAWTDYYSIKGDKEDRKGNFKSDLKLGLDNGRLGFTVNTGYDTKGHNFRAGLGLRALF